MCLEFNLPEVDPNQQLLPGLATTTESPTILLTDDSGIATVAPVSDKIVNREEASKFDFDISFTDLRINRIGVQLIFSTPFLLSGSDAKPSQIEKTNSFGKK